MLSFFKFTSVFIEGSSESIFLSTGASTPLGSLSSEKGGSGSESGSGSGSGSGSRSEADSTLKSHGVLRHTVE